MLSKLSLLNIYNNSQSFDHNFKMLTACQVPEEAINKPSHKQIIIIIISLFQEDNIFCTNASLTYGPQLQR